MPKGIKAGGRKKGTPNKSANCIKAMAQPFGAVALDTLVEAMGSADTWGARVAAAREVLDRAYGKSIQAISNAPGETLRASLEVIFRSSK